MKKFSLNIICKKFQIDSFKTEAWETHEMENFFASLRNSCWSQFVSWVTHVKVEILHNKILFGWSQFYWYQSKILTDCRQICHLKSVKLSNCKQ